MVKAVVCKTIVKTSLVRIQALPNESIKRASDIKFSKWNADRFTSASEYKLLMRVWVIIRAMPNITDSNGDIFSNALYSTHRFSV